MKLKGYYAQINKTLSVKSSNTNFICIVIVIIFLSIDVCYAQRTNSNFGLRSKMGVSTNQERTSGSFNVYNLDQTNTNLEVYLPLLIHVDTTSRNPKVSLLKAQYIFRYTQNRLADFDGVQPLPSELYTNSLAVSYTQTIAYPFFIDLAGNQCTAYRQRAHLREHICTEAR